METSKKSRQISYNQKMEEIKKWSMFISKKLSSGKLKLCLRHGLCRDSIYLPTVFTEVKLKIEKYLLIEATKKKHFSM